MSGGDSGEKSPAPSGASKKLGTLGLAAIVLSSMVGGGIFSLPQNMAAGAAAGAVIIAWIITGIGVYFIADTFRILSAARPDLTAGIYMYSRDGFGNYAGFTIAWGYWLCQIFGNVGYAVITMDALNYFFPGAFKGGNNLWSIIGGSCLIWIFNFTVLRGIKQAASVNFIATVCKILPLAVFIIVMLCVFNFDKFAFDFWGHSDAMGEKNLGGLGAQIKSTMLVTLWAFIGIEGAVVLSGRAKSSKDVGRATILGYAGGLAVFALLSILPFGFMTQAEIAQVANPSTAGVLEKAVGPWGSVLMNVGLIVAILASWLAWTMITAEIPYAAAKDGTFPRVFGAENAAGTPSVSLWITSIIMQLAMLMVYFSNDAWNTMLSITGVMVLPPYLASTAYLWKISAQGKLAGRGKTAGVCARRALVAGVAGSAFALWLIYAAGLEYLLASIIFLALGIPFYIWARRERGQKPFGKKDGFAAVCIAAVAATALALFASGKLGFGQASAPSAPPAAAAKHSPAAKKCVSPMSKRHGESVIIIEDQTEQITF